MRNDEELEACDTSEESLVVKDADDDNNNNEESDPEAANIPLNKPEEVNVQTEVKIEVKEEDNDDNDHDDDKKVTPVLSCAQCGSEFKSKIALVKHRVEVHNKSLKICEICGKTCDSVRSLYDHKRQHKKIECDICHKKIMIFAQISPICRFLGN